MGEKGYLFLYFQQENHASYFFLVFVLILEKQNMQFILRVKRSHGGCWSGAGSKGGVGVFGRDLALRFGQEEMTGAPEGCGWCWFPSWFVLDNLKSLLNTALAVINTCASVSCLDCYMMSVMWSLGNTSIFLPRFWYFSPEQLAYTTQAPCKRWKWSKKLWEINSEQLILKKTNSLLWLCWVLAGACGIFSCSGWDLVPWPGIEPIGGVES